MSPLELLQKLAALIPRPRLNLTRFHGVLAPNAKWRSQVVPSKPAVLATTYELEGDEFSGEDVRAGGRRYISWARLLKRVFGFDIEICPCCGGQLRVIAAIEDPFVMPKALRGAGS